jgi:rfaE bifunctional protein kinase chain/domain
VTVEDGRVVDHGGLLEAVNRFGSCRLLVVGDIMLDQFVWGEVSRISPEAPVPVVEVQDETMLLGGAANVANNLRALGGGVVLGGMIGDDSLGKIFRELAQEQGIDTTSVFSGTRSTTMKTRILARGQQVVRVDRESVQPLDEASTQALAKSFDRVGLDIDGIVVSDYAKGVVTAGLMSSLIDISKRRGIPLLVDPKPVNSETYYGVTLLTPNQREAEILSGNRISDEESLLCTAQEIQERFGTEAVLITRGVHGMALWQRDAGLFSIPTMAREVFDVTGAGDTVIAMLALGMVNGLNMRDAAYLANIAAGVVVGKIGTATVSVGEIRDLLGR